ncbi:pali-domain-containing protein [Cylindrobasidium torrendii FP15055 ss-10]|uniref:Pali-domain-containing protein n=1 Tax=Cylindrobasidium torrendii FP15055 ss-10 TaxID=1314674 RepID=A0A0D7B227_9AGAR|nr:pali-domain-containing protein [Cylindrobasidium torrendii FP15055 ss-10]
MFAPLFTSFSVFSAFLLLLLVSVSTPITQSIRLFTISTRTENSNIFSSSVSGSAHFGVWGYCVEAIQVSIAGADFNTDSGCSEPKLGYTFDKTLAEALQVDEYTDLISRTTVAALVLHPIACGLAFLTLVLSLFMFRRGDNNTARLPSFLTLAVGTLTALVTTAVFLIDVIVVAVLRNKVRDETDGTLTATWGNAVWMVLGAAVALWLAVAGSCAGICACGSRPRFRRGAKY